MSEPRNDPDANGTARVGPRPLVSVILPVYNQCEFVGRAIESVLSQRFTDFEFLVVDDGSTDATPEIIERYADRVRVITQPNQGPYPARNRALREARGEFLAFIDSDDAWLPNRLERQVTILQANPEVALVYGNARIVEGDQIGVPIHTLFEVAPPHRGRVFEALLEARTNFIPQSSVLVRRRYLEETGDFREAPLGADYHKWLQLAYRHPVDYVDEVVCEYRLHAGNISADSSRKLLIASGLLRELREEVEDLRAKRLIDRRILRAEYQAGLAGLRHGARHLFGGLARCHPALSAPVRTGLFLHVLGESIVFLCRTRFLRWRSRSGRHRRRTGVLAGVVTVGLAAVVLAIATDLPKGLYLDYKYRNLGVSEAERDLLEDYVVEIRHPHDSRDPTDESALPTMGGPAIRDHPYFDFYAAFADRMNERETIARMKRVRDDTLAACWPSQARCRAQFLALFGYHDLLPAKGAERSVETLAEEAGIVFRRHRIEGRIGVPFTVLSAVPAAARPRGYVIALHGRMSTPDKVLGLGAGGDDYTRRFGRRWSEAGYAVFAPQIDGGGGIDTRTFGYSPAGQDLAKVLDTVAWVRATGAAGLPVVVAGISYGGWMAEAVGIASGEIAAVVSIGGSARGDFLGGRLGDPGMDVVQPDQPDTGAWPPPLFAYLYRGIGTFRLLRPKALVVSIGSRDTRDDLLLVREIVDAYRSVGLGDRVELNYFVGFHEADPVGEIEAFERLVARGVVPGIAPANIEESK